MRTADELSSVLAAFDEAIVSNDADAIARFVEPDWLFVGPHGTFRGDQFLQSVASGRVTHDAMASDVCDVRIYGDVAVVTARVHNSGTFDGAAFTNDEWSTDVYVRRDDGWRCSLTHLTPAAG
jgi:uncharacterized protein (TIGR02246 family)